MSTPADPRPAPSGEAEPWMVEAAAEYLGSQYDFGGSPAVGFALHRDKLATIIAQHARRAQPAREGEALASAVEFWFSEGHGVHDACDGESVSYIGEPTGDETHCSRCAQERVRRALTAFRRLAPAAPGSQHDAAPGAGSGDTPGLTHGPRTPGAAPSPAQGEDPRILSDADERRIYDEARTAYRTRDMPADNRLNALMNAVDYYRADRQARVEPSAPQPQAQGDPAMSRSERIRSTPEGRALVAAAEAWVRDQCEPPQGDVRRAAVAVLERLRAVDGLVPFRECCDEALIAKIEAVLRAALAGQRGGGC